MKIKVSKDYRITIPKNRLTDLSIGEFAKITIKKADTSANFYFRTPAKCPSRRYLQVRRKLSTDIIRELQLKPLEEVDITLIEPVKKERSRIFTGNSFDLLVLELENVMTESFFKNGEEWVRYWSSSKSGGITKLIELKRYIPINRKTGEFFGLMQAESRKYGKKFDFTNIFISEHKVFLDVAEEFGMSLSQWSFGVIYNPNISEKDVLVAKEEFAKELGLQKDKGYITKSQTITKFAYSISISSKLLNMVMNKTLKKLRKEVYRFAHNNEFKSFCMGFLLKDLLGDGTVGFPSPKSIQICISEPDTKAQKDIINIAEIFGINARVNDIRIYLSTNFDSLLWFLQNKAFYNHKKNRQKIEYFIRKGFYFNILEERLKTINSTTNAKTFAAVNNIKILTAKRYLERKYDRGFLEKAIQNGINTYRLSSKGNEFLRSMTIL